MIVKKGRSDSRNKDTLRLLKTVQIVAFELNRDSKVVEIALNKAANRLKKAFSEDVVEIDILGGYLHLRLRFANRRGGVNASFQYDILSKKFLGGRGPLASSLDPLEKDNPLNSSSLLRIVNAE